MTEEPFGLGSQCSSDGRAVEGESGPGGGVSAMRVLGAQGELSLAQRFGPATRAHAARSTHAVE
jgi:hypothetical protein